MASQADPNQANQGAQHFFGGGWTEIKLRAVSDYLKFYATALKEKPSKNNPFHLWYIDAFAGTGERTSFQQSGGLFENHSMARGIISSQGSARRAIAIVPPFRHLVFIEKDSSRYQVLDRIRSEFPARDIRCLNGDANIVLAKIFDSGPWKGRSASLQRAVVFLDPYGMAVKWDTLRKLAATKRVDVWYLFPLHAVLRQLAHDHSAVDEGKRNSLNDLFGSETWEAEFYEWQQSSPELFGDLFTRKPSRQADASKVEDYAVKRLRTVFPYVSQSIPILTRRKLRQFSLFCLSANPSPTAINLINKGVVGLLKKYGQSS